MNRAGTRNMCFLLLGLPSSYYSPHHYLYVPNVDLSIYLSDEELKLETSAF